MHTATNAKKIKNKTNSLPKPEISLQIIIVKTEVDHQDSKVITRTITIEEEIIIQVKTTDNTLLIIGITLLIHPITLHQTDIGQVVTTLEIDKIREIHTGLIEIVAEIDQTVSRDTEIIQTNEAMIQIDKVTDLTVAITHEIIAESEVLKCTS